MSLYSITGICTRTSFAPTNRGGNNFVPSSKGGSTRLGCHDPKSDIHGTAVPVAYSIKRFCTRGSQEEHTFSREQEALFARVYLRILSWDTGDEAVSNDWKQQGDVASRIANTDHTEARTKPQLAEDRDILIGDRTSEIPQQVTDDGRRQE